MAEKNTEIPTDKEFHEHMQRCIEEFHGDSEKLSNAVGMMYVGRIYGWEHQRVVSPRSTWKLATKTFGDPKELLPKRTPLAEKKSNAIKVIDKLSQAGKLLYGYIDVVQGKFTIPREDRKAILK